MPKDFKTLTHEELLEMQRAVSKKLAIKLIVGSVATLGIVAVRVAVRAII